MDHQPMIHYHFWLRFGRDGGVPKASKNPPAIATDERAMQIQLSVPRAVFDKPSLQAHITVAHEENAAVAIDVDAAEFALHQALGCDVIVSVVPPEDPNAVKE